LGIEFQSVATCTVKFCFKIYFAIAGKQYLLAGFTKPVGTGPVRPVPSGTGPARYMNRSGSHPQTVLIN
jgi:hypothetical protein